MGSEALLVAVVEHGVLEAVVETPDELTATVVDASAVLVAEVEEA